MNEAKIKVGRYLFDRHGGLVVFFGRFVSILRTYVAFLARASLMHWRRFLVYNACGGIVWAAAVTSAAYFLGTGVHRVSTVITYLGAAVAVVAAIALVRYLRRHFKRLEEAAEQAYPGPLDDDWRPVGRQPRQPSPERPTRLPR